MTMQIIDFEKKGNVVRFYLGDASQPYWGDDWNDAPYDCNAGTVYEKYIKGYKDIAFPFDDLVLEPCDGAFFNVDVSKEDMMHRAVPCIIVVPYAVCKDAPWDEDFQHWIGVEGVQKYYFGDEWLNHAPTVDAVPVIRCKDCKHWACDDSESYCDELGIFNTDMNSYCSYAKRKEE